MAINVAVHIVGLNRSLSVTARSLHSRVIQPLTLLPGFRVFPDLVLIRPNGPIINRLSGEAGPVESEIPPELSAFPVAFLDQDALAEVAQKLTQKLLSPGDVYGDRGKSIENSLIYMQALNYCAANCGFQSDVTIVLRPDIRLGGSIWVVPRVLWLALRARLRKPLVLVPAWGSFGGFNDRFAMMSGQLSDLYLRRFDKIPSWLEEGRPFDPESFLAFALSSASVRRAVYAPMFRIRIAGRLEVADLDFFQLPPFVARLRNFVVKAIGRLRRPADSVPEGRGRGVKH